MNYFRLYVPFQSAEDSPTDSFNDIKRSDNVFSANRTLNKGILLLLNVVFLCSCTGKIINPAEPVTEETYTTRVTETYEKFANKDYRGAIQEASSVIEFNPNSPEAYYNRAMSKLKINDKNGCLDDLKMARILYAQQNNTIGVKMTLQTIESLSENKGKERKPLLSSSAKNTKNN